MGKRLLLMWFGLLCLCGEGWGEITCPDKVEVGKLLVVECTDVADVFIWNVPDGIDYVAIDGNKKLVCAGLEGTYRFGLVAIKIDWDTKAVVPSNQQTKVVTIGKGLPPVPPVPDPDKPPLPPAPVLTGLAKDVYDWGMASSAKDKGAELSKNYGLICTKYGKGEVTVEQAFNQLRELNNKTLNTRELKDSWAVFGSRLEEKLNAAWPMQKDVLTDFLKAVSLGLSYVK
jgi:hypothetical protein